MSDENTTLTGDTGADPSAYGDSGADPSAYGDSGADPSAYGDSGADPSAYGDSGADPSAYGNSGADPSAYGDSGADPSAYGDSGADPSAYGDSGADPSAYGNSGADPSAYGDSGADPSAYGNSGADPSAYGNSGADPSAYGNSGADPSAYGNSGADPSRYAAGDSGADPSRYAAGDSGADSSSDAAASGAYPSGNAAASGPYTGQGAGNHASSGDGGNTLPFDTGAGAPRRATQRDYAPEGFMPASLGAAVDQSEWNKKHPPYGPGNTGLNGPAIAGPPAAQATPAGPNDPGETPTGTGQCSCCAAGGYLEDPNAPGKCANASCRHPLADHTGQQQQQQGPGNPLRVALGSNSEAFRNWAQCGNQPGYMGQWATTFVDPLYASDKNAPEQAWQFLVRSRIYDPNYELHISLDGGDEKWKDSSGFGSFGAKDPLGIFLRAASQAFQDSSVWGTRWEMALVYQAVRTEARPFSSIKFYLPYDIKTVPDFTDGEWDQLVLGDEGWGDGKMEPPPPKSGMVNARQFVTWLSDARSTDTVGIGSTVTFSKDGGPKQTFQIGSAYERPNPKAGVISAASPVGKALLECRVGDKPIYQGKNEWGEPAEIQLTVLTIE
jgi:hypothetical protein